MLDYIVIEFDNTNDVLEIVKMMTDTKIIFERKNKPHEMTK